MTQRRSRRGHVRLPPERRRRRRPPSARSRRIWLATGLAAAVVLAVTLVPGRPTGSSPGGACLVCGHFAMSDFLLNVALFVPLGFVPALRRRWPALAIWVTLVGVAAAIEAVQLLLPGRYSSLADVVANAAGAGLGVFLARSRGRWLPTGDPPVPPAFRVASGAAAGLVFLATALALRPSLPLSSWYGQWTPELGQYETYGGRVEQARLGDRPLPSGRLRESDSVRAELLGGVPVDLVFRGGPETERVAPVFAIYDDVQRQMLLLGAQGDDLLLRVRRRSADLRLKAPQLRARGAAPASGATVEASVAIRDGAACLAARVEETCDALAPPARGWSLLLGPAPRAIPARGVDAIFAALLLVPLGLWWRRDGAGLAGAGLAGAGVVLAALAGGAGAADVVAALAGGMAGGGLGAAIRGGGRRLSRRKAPRSRP